MAGYMTSGSIVVRQGDSFDILLHIRNSRGGNVNLKDCQISMTVKNKENQKIMFTVIGEIVDKENGKAIISLQPQLTDIAVGDYVCDIQIEFSNGDIHTIYPKDINKLGIFTITEQVTR